MVHIHHDLQVLAKVSPERGVATTFRGKAQGPDPPLSEQRLDSIEDGASLLTAAAPFPSPAASRPNQGSAMRRHLRVTTSFHITTQDSARDHWNRPRREKAPLAGARQAAGSLRRGRLRQSHARDGRGVRRPRAATHGQVHARLPDPAPAGRRRGGAGVRAHPAVFCPSRGSRSRRASMSSARSRPGWTSPRRVSSSTLSTSTRARNS